MSKRILTSLFLYLLVSSSLLAAEHITTEHPVLDYTEINLQYMPVGIESDTVSSEHRVGYRFENGFALDAGLDDLNENGNLPDFQIGTGHAFQLDNFSDDLSKSVFNSYHFGASYELDDRTQLGILCRSSLDENAKNNYHMAIGGSYQYDEHWQLKWGTLLDGVTDHRIPRVNLLNQDRASIALGLQYSLTQHLAVDAGYSYIIYQKDQHSALSSLLYNSEMGLKGLHDNLKNQTNRVGLRFTWEVI